MASSKKYEYELEQVGDTWSAKITRKINSRKRATTKQMADFKSEDEAKVWAKNTLVELSNKQKSSNVIQGKRRKDIEEIKRLRSARRAEKTEQEKADALKLQEELDLQQANEENQETIEQEELLD